MKKSIVPLMLILVFVLGVYTAAQESTDINFDETVDIVVWHPFSGPTGEVFESIVAAYNEGRGSDINVVVESVFQGYEGTSKVVLAYQTKDTQNAPDINFGLTSTIPEIMDLDWAVNLDSYLTSDPDVNKDTFYPQLQRAVTFRGEMVAVPFANSIPVLYYNVDHFAETGIDASPTTFDELTAATIALTQRDGDGNVTRWGFAMNNNRYTLVTNIVSQNENAFFADNEGGRLDTVTEITAREDGTLRAYLEQLEMLYATGGFRTSESKEDFANGLISMSLMSTSRLGFLDTNMQGAYMVAPIPNVNTGDTSGAPVGGSSINVFNRGDENRVVAAWDFIKFLVSAENQATFSQVSGYLPVNVETENLPEMIAFYETHPQYQAALDAMKASHPNSQEPMEIVYSDVNAIVPDVLSRFLAEDLTVDEAVDSITDQINAALDEYHLAND